MAIRAIIVLVLLVLTSDIFANNGHYDCLQRLETDEPLGDSITVRTLDHRTFRGARPMLNFSSSLLTLRLPTDSGNWTYQTVSFTHLDEITYRKHRTGRSSMTLLGFGAGVIIGGLIGVALAPEPEGWLDMPEVATGMIGVFIGGILGAVGGNAIASRMTVEVKLKCW